MLVLDKTGVGAGASGIACGVVRNNYFQPAMSELMAACVEVWESDPEALHYHGSGYIALGPPAQESDLVEVYERQQRIGYPSELYIGEEEVAAHMRSLYRDWRAPGPHRLPARARRRLRVQPASRCSGSPTRPAQPAREIATGVEVTGFELDNAGAVTAVHTDRRRHRTRAGRGRGRAVDRRRSGRCSASPTGSTSASPTARSQPDLPMWTYWYLQEGEIEFDPAQFITDDGNVLARAPRRLRPDAARRRRRG